MFRPSISRLAGAYPSVDLVFPKLPQTPDLVGRHIPAAGLLVDRVPFYPEVGGDLFKR